MSVTHVDKDLDALTLTMTAEFAAPLDAVWQVWADPRKLERWWGPPTHPATFVAHDLRPGGRMHYFMTMRHATEGWLASTSEQISMCVDMKARKSTAWPLDVQERIRALFEVHRQRPRPPEAGRTVGIRRKA